MNLKNLSPIIILFLLVISSCTMKTDKDIVAEESENTFSSEELKNIYSNLADKYVVINKLSAIAFAILPMVFAVAGAIIIASAHNPKST